MASATDEENKITEPLGEYATKYFIALTVFLIFVLDSNKEEEGKLIVKYTVNYFALTYFCTLMSKV